MPKWHMTKRVRWLSAAARPAPGVAVLEVGPGVGGEPHVHRHRLVVAGGQLIDAGRWVGEPNLVIAGVELHAAAVLRFRCSSPGRAGPPGCGSPGGAPGCPAPRSSETGRWGNYESPHPAAVSMTTPWTMSSCPYTSRRWSTELTWPTFSAMASVRARRGKYVNVHQ